MSITFEEALRESEDLLHEFEESGCSAELQEKLSDMLSCLPSCRGFFVTFLTGDSALADKIPEYMIDLLGKSEHVPELLVKNLVMSVTMKITHERQGNVAGAQGSDLVARRSASLIAQLKSPLVRTRLLEMRSSIKTRAGIFADFLKRWNYDDEQLKSATEAIEKALER